MYSVLKFLDPVDPTEVVPTIWVDEANMKTKWPPYKQPEKIYKAVRKCFVPQHDWLEYTYNLLVYQCDDYEEASKKRQDAELYSDIENTEKNKQTRKNRHKIVLSDCFDSDDLSPPLKIIKKVAQLTTSNKNNSTGIADCEESQDINLQSDLISNVESDLEENKNESFANIDQNENKISHKKKVDASKRISTNKVVQSTISNKKNSIGIVNYKESQNNNSDLVSSAESDLEEKENESESTANIDRNKNKISYQKTKVDASKRISANTRNILLSEEHIEIDETSTNNNNLQSAGIIHSESEQQSGGLSDAENCTSQSTQNEKYVLRNAENNNLPAANELINKNDNNDRHIDATDENKPLAKKVKYDIFKKKREKRIPKQGSRMWCKAERAKLQSWDCWECEKKRI